jgi:phenylpropionate dioxygenase-like ring-hydroxylating dioxygenase large terminal subunit
MAVVRPKPIINHGPAPVQSLPITPERYISAEWMQREYDAMWPKNWLFACLEQDVRETGEFVRFNLGRESIIISRGQDGEVHAMYNACQHRGARICVTERGCVKSFVCPYHGWSYRPDGHLVVVPGHHLFEGGVNREERSLPKVRCETFMGLVFICMDNSAPPLLESLGLVAERLAPFHLERMTLVGDQTVFLEANWKAVFDNFGELYHVEHIHPQHAMLFDCPTAQVELYPNGHTSVEIVGHTVNSTMPIPEEANFYQRAQCEKFGLDPDDFEGRVLDFRLAMQQRRREMGPSLGYDYSDLSDTRLTDIEQYNLFPNTMVTVQPEAALVMRARPHPTDPNKCYWDKFTFKLQPNPAVAERAGVAFKPWKESELLPIPRPEHDEFTQEDVIAGRKTMDATVDQDIHFIRDIQSGMHSRGFTSQLLNEEEARVQHYHDWLDHFMGLR